ncbi:MAG: sigma-70 family RNA polymerase sigma factor [Pyrinomonadaceae bacterium]|nr:sigma-70 family RNA polymerase sigma factor [Pyrinomonadaceae bacterium]MCX7640517.1 sigma-70 family RNA polymerase sigma factor [Pyrinomonadaceae bacterium]MDW8303902.1 sigma-70 family RNA polymerase sigma factor [Acidobacteriota bacterium]
MFKSVTISEDLKDLEVTTDGHTVEAEFIEKLKAGDAEAFDKLVVKHIQDIYKFLLRITGDSEEAYDLTQETFLKAIKGIKSFRGDADLKTWLFRIAINLSNSRFRWLQKRKNFTVLSFDQEDIDWNNLASKETENPEEKTLQKEREKILLEALMAIPKNFREAIILRDVEGFSYEEISEILQVNLGTVKSRIARGREELRKYLSDANFDRSR